MLLDNGVPRGVSAALVDCEVEEARNRGWDTFKNGDLLTAAEAAGFDVLVTTDQNPATSRISSVVRSRSSCSAVDAGGS